MFFWAKNSLITVAPKFPTVLFSAMAIFLNSSNKYVLKFLLGEINLSIKTINKDFYKHI